jgi:hypothetical protein
LETVCQLCMSGRRKEEQHTVIVSPPAAAVAGMDVVAVPVDRAVDMLRSVCLVKLRVSEIQRTSRKLEERDAR